MISFRTIFRTVKPFLGKIDVRIDRARQLIYFKRNGKTEILTVDQLFDEIERIIPDARSAAQITLDPFSDCSIERMVPPGGSWLSDYDKPRTDPLGNNGQALNEPARHLAAR